MKKKIIMAAVVLFAAVVIARVAIGTVNADSLISASAEEDLLSFEEGVEQLSADDMSLLINSADLSNEEKEEIFSLGTATKGEYVRALLAADPGVEAVLNSFGVAAPDDWEGKSD